MRKVFLGTVSALIIVSGVAFAADEVGSQSREPSAGEKIEQGLDSIGEGLEKAGREAVRSAEELGEAAGETAEDIEDGLDKAAQEASAAVDEAQESLRRHTQDKAAAGLLFRLPASAVTAETLLGVELTSRTGETIAEIDDLLIGADGRITHLVLSDAKVPGYEGDTLNLPLSQVELRPHQTGEEIEITARLRGDGVAAAPINVDDPRIVNRSYASTFKGMDVATADGGTAEIEDLVIMTDGTVTHAILDFDDLLAIGGKDVALPFAELQLIGREKARVALSEDQVRALPEFETETR